MFVEYSTTVEIGMPDVEKRFSEIRSGLDDQTDMVYREGHDLLSRVGPTPAVAREVKLNIGPVEIQQAGLVVPIHWVARAAEGLFPELNADLVFSHAGRRRTRLTLRGTYQPPLGPVGRLADRAVMGRVAEAAVVDWMDRLTSALNSDALGSPLR